MEFISLEFSKVDNGVVIGDGKWYGDCILR